MLALLSTLFTSIISGGATGILGVAVQRFFDLKNKATDLGAKKLQYEHELAMKHADAAILEKEYAARVTIAQTEAEAAGNVADAQSFAASFQDPVRYADSSKATTSQGWAFVVLDFIRGIIRPFLTVYLCVVTTLIYFHAKTLISQPLSAAESLDLVRLIVGTVLYLTTTCVLWWFGTRNKQPAPRFK